MKAPYREKMNSKYGAPMGRRSCEREELVGRLHIREVRMYDGAYDFGGAYWGGGYGTLPLWCAWDNEGNAHYFRAMNRAAALEFMGNRPTYAERKSPTRRCQDELLAARVKQS